MSFIDGSGFGAEGVEDQLIRRLIVSPARSKPRAAMFGWLNDR